MDPSENNQKETPNENNSPTIPSNNVVEPNLQSPLSEDSHLESKPTQPKVQTGPKKSKNWLLIILIIVVVITALVLAYIYLIKNKTTVTPKSHSVVIKKDISKVTLAINDDTDLTPNTPLSMTGSTEEFIVAYQMFDGLVGFQNQAKIIPGLAVSWSNPSDTTWDFNIRHNVKFHTGRTLTSNDVKFSLDYAVAHQSDQDNGTFALLAYGIKKVTVIDPYKIQIETNGPDATLLGQLANLFIVDSKASLTDPNSGTGAYKLSTSTLNGRVLDLTPFKDYWGGHVYTRELVITQNESKDDMASALINNKIDMGGNFQNAQLDTINSKAKKNNSYINNFKIQEPGSHYIQLNTARQNSPLSD
ncbi:MAG TPA: ABC transporter substrate-binding protein, partial [Patescibacteria group bacterium]|nr:ABC transporter substrate-binding protein [Patescibacteria group bacterium]